MGLKEQRQVSNSRCLVYTNDHPEQKGNEESLVDGTLLKNIRVEVKVRGDTRRRRRGEERKNDPSTSTTRRYFVTSINKGDIHSKMGAQVSEEGERRDETA